MAIIMTGVLISIVDLRLVFALQSGQAKIKKYILMYTKIIGGI